ncbi:MAG: DHHW family protein [Oscillospiraceae bacterium]|nr:DHHW family protein [Oscillospiraceae bacterium]
MKKTNALNIALFILVLAVVSPLLLFAPRPETSETERRELEPFPEFSFAALFSGDFTRDLSTYFSDTVPMRDNITDTSAYLKDKAGISFDGVTLHNVVIADNPDNPENPVLPNNPYIQDNPVTPNNPTSTTNSVNLDNPDNIDISDIPTDDPAWDGVIGENTNDVPDGVADIGNNGILVYQNRGLMLFGGSYAMGERYARAMNAYADRLDMNVYSMVIPTPIEFYCPRNYRHLSSDQRANTNNINSFLHNVTPVNIYSALSARVNEDIYLRTDHHWAALGAYYAAEEFAKTAGVPFIPLSEYETVVIPGYVGTMYGYSGDISLKNNPEDFIYYKPPNSYTTTYYNYDNPTVAINSSLFIGQSVGMSYCIFMGGDNKITHIKTDVNNGRRLAIFKDSFGNALVPFFTGSFEEIIVIDIRYFPYKAVDYLTEHGVTDILFANNIFAANTGSMIGYIEGIME